MRKKFTEVIDLMDLNELISMKNDIDEGGRNINRIVTSKIKEELRKHDVFCCVCSSRIDPYSPSNFTIIFGPDDMKKKATFCAIDCLEYFLKNLKDFWGTDNQAFVRNKKIRSDTSR